MSSDSRRSNPAADAAEPVFDDRIPLVSLMLNKKANPVKPLTVASVDRSGGRMTMDSKSIRVIRAPQDSSVVIIQKQSHGCDQANLISMISHCD